jgi:hypothetical protein
VRTTTARGRSEGMSRFVSFLRTLPQRLWWVTLFFAVLAFFTQMAIAVARSGAVAWELLLAEFTFTVVLLALPVGIAWKGKQENSLWFAGGGLILLAVMARIFFF